MAMMKRQAAAGGGKLWNQVRLLGCCVLAFAVFAARLHASSPTESKLTDPDYDVVARPTDPGAQTPFDPQQHRLINLLEIVLKNWAPNSPAIDLFSGSASETGSFVRIDVVVEGLVNPPGRTDPGLFDPFRYGAHPIYGFVEIDMDDDNETGGEVDAPEFRFLGNAARFGGLPEDSRFSDRLAKSDAAFDGNFLTDPFVERSGEEFHITFLGSVFQPSDIVEASGDGDMVFESDERWIITAPWFHRAHGFEPFSVASGGMIPGEYAPDCELRFDHDAATDTTQISLVFPLTNAASAAMRSEVVQPNNNDPSDQASIDEAFDDLAISASIVNMFPTGEPDEVLILGWASNTPGEDLDPTTWRLTALLGTSYTVSGAGFVWTDMYPNALRGNVNGENGVNLDDQSQIVGYISDHDLDDGSLDGQVIVAQFASGFSVFDVNHDGVVDGLDTALLSVEGDLDLDGDVDLADMGIMQRCHGSTGVTTVPCALADLDANGDVDLSDYRRFSAFVAGPAGGP
ncbi:MAG: hypothetical protein GXP29_13485 [Planctomycetes bacterium]|nr:hypothetical protein [Planctomycetota bacterium]